MNQRRSKSRQPLAAAVTTAALATAAIAGPLDPPAGPVDSTYKTLDQVQPATPINEDTAPQTTTARHRINVPGVYYLTGDVAAGDGQNAIVVGVSDVTIDLNGYTLVGQSLFAEDTLSGVDDDLEGQRHNITIRNGTIRGFAVSAVSLRSADDVTLENVDAIGNRGDGVALGDRAVVRDCRVVGTLGQAPFDGDGLETGDAARIVDTLAEGNAGDGIRAGEASIVERCVAVGNTDSGVLAAAGSSITRCVARENGLNGVAVTAGSVDECISTDNGEDGVAAAGACRVTDNLASGNGAAGVLLFGLGGAHAQGNTCVDNDRGVRVFSAHNVIVGNACAGSAIANWDIAADNAFGPIVVAGSPLAIMGDVAPGSLNTSDPHANFTYEP